MSAGCDHGCFYELFADLAAHGGFDGDEAREEGGGPVGGVGNVEKGVGGHGEVQTFRSWIVELWLS